MIGTNSFFSCIYMTNLNELWIYYLNDWTHWKNLKATTVPCCENKSCRSSSVVVGLKYKKVNNRNKILIDFTKAGFFTKTLIKWKNIQNWTEVHSLEGQTFTSINLFYFDISLKMNWSPPPPPPIGWLLYSRNVWEVKCPWRWEYIVVVLRARFLESVKCRCLEVFC